MSDPRFSDIIIHDASLAEHGDIIILGVPTDEGIRRNGGREGASQAPNEIKKYLGKLTPVNNVDATPFRKKIIDIGNADGNSLEEIHSNASELTKKYSALGCFVITIGGGHDITYPVVCGIHGGRSESKARLGLINIDAHLDVREKKNGLHHSGSSFRLLIEKNIIDPKQFIEFGIQPFSASTEHLEWVKSVGGNVEWLEDIQSIGVERAFEESVKNINGDFYLSFDIDSIRSADAPGSSAPSPIGFTAEQAINICRIAANSGRLASMDIVEVSPLFDYDGRASRLAARMIATAITTTL